MAAPAIAFAAGVAAAGYAGPAGASLAGATAALAAAALFLGKRSHALLLTVCACSALAGSVRLLSSVPELDPDVRFVEPGEPVIVRFKARVVSVEPQLHVAGETPATVFVADIRGFLTNEAYRVSRGRVRVRVNGPVSVGRNDEVEVTGSMKDPPPAGNPGQFDAAARFAERGIGASVFSPSADCVRILARGAVTPLSVLESARLHISASLGRAMPGESGNLLRALLLGDQSGISPGAREAFSRSGTMHLLAVSGLHLMLLTAGLFAGLRIVGAPRRLSACIIVLFAWCYAGITGARDPVLRAAIMTTVFFVADLAGRERDSWNALSLSGLIILFLRPFDLFSAGFQLSFSAVAGILAFSRPIATGLLGAERMVLLLSAFPGDRARAGVMSWVGGSVAVSTAAWIATAPIMWHHFKLITPVVPVANIVAGPLAAAALGAGMLSVPAACAFPTAWPLFAPAEVIAWALSQTARFFATLPFSHLYLPSPPVWRILAAYFFLVWVAARPLLPAAARRPHWTMPAALAALALLVPVQADRPSGMEATVLDVGQGLCVVARFPDGRVVVYDAGTKGDYDVGTRVIAPYLWSKRVSRIDLLVLSHSDADHVSAIRPLTERFRVKAAMVHPGFSGSNAGRDVLEALESKAVRVHFASRGHDPPGGFSDVVEILHPPASWPAGSISRNDRSLTVSLKFAGKRLLLPGDLERQGLAELAANCGGRFDAIVAPHHGANEPAGNEPFAILRPALVVASCDRSFRVTETEGVYERFGARFFKTWRHGAVTIRFGPDSSVEAFAFR